jgi:ribosomal protein L30E
MSTNPIGKGTVNLTANIPSELKADLERLAKESGMKIGQYTRLILAEAVKTGTVVEQQVITRPKKKAAAPGKKPNGR